MGGLMVPRFYARGPLQQAVNEAVLTRATPTKLCYVSVSTWRHNYAM